MKDNNIFCIIVTYNAMKWINKCLCSLRESTIKVSPVVIDNCSKDETVSYIAGNFPEVHMICNKNNRGFGQANNQGIEYAYKKGCSHFFLLNQDAYVHHDTIEKLIAVQDFNHFALVSPIHLNGEGNLLDSSFFSATIITTDSLAYVSDLTVGNVKPYYEVFKVNAAAWLLSRDIVEKVGGFDPIFFHYGEDGNYAQRIHYHGGKVAFIPGAYVNHDRKKQGNIKMYNKKEAVMMLLYYYCDVNKPVYKPTFEILKLHFHHLCLFVKFLFTFKFTNLSYLISGYIEFISKLNKIVFSVKRNRTSGLNWLNVE